MKVIVIDAVAQTAERADLPGTRGILDFFPNGISFCGRLETGDAVYIDEDALLNLATHFVLLPCYPMPLPMKVLVTGPDSEDGEATLDVQITAGELKACIQWADRAAFEAWANDHGRAAAISLNGATVTTWSEMAAKSRPVTA